MSIFDSTPLPSIDKGMVYLVVDDFDAMCKVTVNQLEALGAEKVLTARNGAEALRILRSEHVDIVLSDWNMPVLSGLELLKAMRADPKLFALPFVMITAEAERHKVEEAIASGVTSLLLKPYTSTQLHLRIQKAKNWKPRLGSTNVGRLQGANSAQSTTPSVKSLTPARPKILLVDDTPDNLLLLSQMLKADYQVQLARDGAKALEIVTSDSPRLGVAGHMMPGMDGFEVATRMREHPSAESIPVIFVTAMTSVDARIKGMDLGAVDFITKPVDAELLKPRIRNFMRYVEMRKDLQAEYDDMVDAAQLRDDVDRITRHDLKGPLSGVLGMVQNLIQDEDIGHKQVAQLRLIEEASMQLLNMISLSAELYKIETGRFVLKAAPIRIGEVLRRIAEMYRFTYAEKQIVVSVDTDMPVGAEFPLAKGDATLCYSVFQNLIKNACEAAPNSSKVAIRLLDQSPIKIVIENKGAVPQSVRARFFEKFVTHGKEGGTGLGTYSAKLLTEAQLGNIELNVRDDTNTTTITVTLPRA
ncbi:MAG: response regulator [Betaproteobacteria bacterium]|nr:response regulator [Betaproteobacteria bacterium]